MIGLIVKDFLVFEKCFHWIYRLAGVILLAGVVTLSPEKGVHYIALMLPAMGVAFLTEIVKVEEQSDWKEYLPALPVTSREVVLSKYGFSGILLAACALLSFALCVGAALRGGFPLAAVWPDYLLGVCFAVLMVYVAIPSGFLFKNESCTGAMMGVCVLVGVVRSAGGCALLLSPVSPVIYALLTGMGFLSYHLALWIYRMKRYGRPGTNGRPE